MIGAENLFANGERASIERFRFREASLPKVVPAQLIQGSGDVRTFSAKQFFADVQSTLQKRPRFSVACLSVAWLHIHKLIGIPSLGLVNVRQHIEGCNII